jgi:4-hydroxybenzoate polyprenyltransferase
MTARSISPATLPRRFGTYLGERFPPVEYAVAVGLFYFAASLTGARLVGARALTTATAAGLVTVFLVFLHLRLMDEVKDADHDARHFPQRAVPRGLITLQEVRALCVAVIAGELLLNARMPWPVLLSFLAALAFTLLMFREFFIGRALRANFLVYTLVHMPVLPLLSLYAYAIVAVSGETLRIAAPFTLFLVASYAGGLTLEIARKLHAPDNEPADVYTYSKHLGTAGVTTLLLGLDLVQAGCAFGLGAALGLGAAFAAGVAVACGTATIALIRFRTRPTERLASQLERAILPASVLGPYVLLVLGVAIA